MNTVTFKGNVFHLEGEMPALNSKILSILILLKRAALHCP